MKDKHKGKIVNIIGKGPSLRYLKKDHFVDGPVIALNHAITVVEPFELPDTYSFQKDKGTVIPNGSFLLLNRRESLNYLEDYKPRFVLDFEMLGLPGNECSMIFAIQLAKLWGCSGFRFISFDAHTNGDNRTYFPGGSIKRGNCGYESQVPKIKNFIDGFDSEWITPTKRS